MELIGGLEETFVERGLSILLHVVPTQAEEIAAYRRWAAGGVAEAVIVPNLVADDPRPAVLSELGLPAVLVGSWQGAGAFSTVRAHDAEPVQDAAARLLALGHRRIARVTGPQNLLHTQARSAALVEACAPHGIVPVIVEGDYTERSGADLTEALLRSPEPPTAIVYDNDLMAIGGLRVAEELGVDVPGRLSVVAWDDSTLCRLATPPLTVLALDVHQYGITVAEAVLDVLDGKPPVERWAPPSRWLERASTGPAPTARA